MIPYNQKYLIFDTETEGLNLLRSRPWQLAWSLAEGNQVKKVYDEYIDFPDLEVSDAIIRLTGFSWYEYNKRKKPPEEVWGKFKKDLFNEENIIVGQNLLGFDVYILGVLQKILGETPDYSYMNRIYDTRAIGKAYKEGLEKPKNGDFLSWQYKVMHDRTLKTKASQLALLKGFGIVFDESKLHNAVYDNEMCFKNFLELKKRMNL
jgi:DNA polymerase III epsilon subunit-like protein